MVYFAAYRHSMYPLGVPWRSFANGALYGCGFIFKSSYFVFQAVVLVSRVVLSTSIPQRASLVPVGGGVFTNFPFAVKSGQSCAPVRVSPLVPLFFAFLF